MVEVLIAPVVWEELNQSNVQLWHLLDELKEKKVGNVAISLAL
jgi:hypothetical protein